MATFNDLVRVVAEVEGMEPMTVRGIGIKVREAGLISKSGRGLSAARMTIEDATALLIGVNGTSMAKDAAEAVRAFQDLRLKFDRTMPEDHSEWGDTRDESDPLERTLRFDTPFHKTLAAFIAACVPRDDGSSDFEARFGSDVVIMITFERPVRRASVTVYWDASDEDELPEYLTDAGFESPGAARGVTNDPDRSDATTIGARTLLAVGRILAT